MTKRTFLMCKTYVIVYKTYVFDVQNVRFIIYLYDKTFKVRVRVRVRAKVKVLKTVGFVLTVTLHSQYKTYVFDDKTYVFDVQTYVFNANV